MLGKRILTALIGIPAAIYIINFGQWLFVAAVFLLAIIAWHEFSVMLKLKKIEVWYSLGLAGITASIAFSWLGNIEELLAVIVILVILIMIKAVFSQSSFTMTNAAFTIMGIFYIGILFSHLVLLRFTGNFEYISTSLGTMSAGAMYLWLAFIGTWASDTFAYLVGSRWGRRKLCPSISPGKTCEGALGGLLGCVLSVTVFGIMGNFPVYHLIVLGLLIGIFAPLGDLTESALKRFTSVKDSGRIFPGHGGVLDRFDAIMFSTPVVYYYVNAFLTK